MKLIFSGAKGNYIVLLCKAESEYHYGIEQKILNDDPTLILMAQGHLSTLKHDVDLSPYCDYQFYYLWIPKPCLIPKSILIIGQAPPAKAQTLPYDSTQLYDWLSLAGISKEEAQELFIFEALVPTFTGRNNTNSGHKRPSKQEVLNYWPVLELHLQLVDKVILLGAVAGDYYDRMPRTWSCNMQELYLLHPSKRNVHKFRQQKDFIISSLKNLIYA